MKNYLNKMPVILLTFLILFSVNAAAQLFQKSIDNEYDKGIKYLSQGDSSRAQDVFEKITTQVNHGKSAYQLAQLEAQKMNYTKALALYQQAKEWLVAEKNTLNVSVATYQDDVAQLEMIIKLTERGIANCIENDATPPIFVAKTTDETKSYIELLSPNGGEKWEMGSIQTIQWKSFQLERGVKIEINHQFPNGDWIFLDEVLNEGLYSWTVEGFEGTGQRIRITSTSKSEITDESDQNFSIFKNETVIKNKDELSDTNSIQRVVQVDFNEANFTIHSNPVIQGFLFDGGNFSSYYAYLDAKTAGYTLPDIANLEVILKRILTYEPQAFLKAISWNPTYTYYVISSDEYYNEFNDAVCKGFKILEDGISYEPAEVPWGEAAIVLLIKE